MAKLISSQINSEVEKGSLNCDGKCHEGSCYSGFAEYTESFDAKRDDSQAAHPDYSAQQTPNLL
ncbi:hypothetical protein V6Z11_D13G186900 [Gossypium hirsutum]